MAQRLIPIVAAMVGLTPLLAEAKPKHAERDVQQVIDQHFQAIQQGDRDALMRLWITERAQVSHAEGAQLVSVPVTDSIALWTATPTPDAEWTIHDIEVLGEDLSMVSARLEWKGATYEEVLTLMKMPEGWRLVSKTYTVTSMAPNPTTIGY